VPLTEATVRALVDEWAATVPTTWTVAETGNVVDRLVRISAQVTPHVVPDEVIADDDLQQFLLMNAVRLLEDWFAGAARNLRVAYGIETLQRTSGGDQAIGLRSATQAELEGLPGIDRLLAERIGRFVAQQPGLEGLDRLIDIDGIGPDRLQQLRESAYLDQPRVGLVSNSLATFLLDPNVRNFLTVLERTDLFFLFGDHNTLVRRLPAADGSPGARFVRFLELVLEQATLVSSVASGVLASRARRWLARHRLRDGLLAGATLAGGAVLVNETYLASARRVLENAASAANLMVFLGTASAGDALHPGPLQLVEAMEAAAARGVTVRTILDQDDGGATYGSVFINRPLVERFRANGVGVKFDREDVLLHSKVLVVDRAAAIVGSHNWTGASFNETHELSILIEAPEVARQFDDRFRSLWDQLPAIT
jgi:hypothetical protein